MEICGQHAKLIFAAFRLILSGMKGKTRSSTHKTKILGDSFQFLTAFRLMHTSSDKRNYGMVQNETNQLYDFGKRGRPLWSPKTCQDHSFNIEPCRKQVTK
ncbi:MAG: hypothetical protein DWQ04_04430 [Chloroflexi bacterium]|nr:MAG: hypothetical protein DWQ04_04430 [Chloroflexota bacterium]